MADALPDDLAVALSERNRAFEADDLEWARKQMPTAVDPRVVEMAFHKARYECRAVSAKKRRESQAWLIENHVRPGSMYFTYWHDSWHDASYDLRRLMRQWALAQVPAPLQARRGTEGAMARIPDHLLKAPLYLYPSVVDAEKGESIGGTGFHLAEATPDRQAAYVYIITNRHVIEDGNTVIRVNRKKGGFICHETDERDWLFHPEGDDVAALLLTPNISVLDVQLVPRHMSMTPDLIQQAEIGPGDEAYTIGRFVSHEGRAQNTPVVRFGCLAQMPHEPIRSQHPSGPFEQISFLVEARSIPGFSGSPVFVHIPAGASRPGKSFLESYTDTQTWLLGVDWAHLNSWEPARDEFGNELPFKVRANPGMMAVVPAWRLDQLLDGEEMKERRGRMDQSRSQPQERPAVSKDSAKGSTRAVREFNKTIKALLDTPHKPHKPTAGREK